MSLPITIQALTTAQAQELERVFRLLQAGHAEDALAFGMQLVAEATRAPDAYQLLALCHAEAGNTVESEQAFLHALELAPNHPLVLLNYATMLRKTGRLDAALGALQRAVAAAPDFAKAWIELGVTTFEAGLHPRAIAALTRAVQLEPASVLAWHLLGNSSRASGDLEAAEAAFRQVISLDPQHRTAWLNLGAVLRLSGRPDEAVACFERIGQSGDTSPELADACVGALLDDGKLDKALHLAKQVTRQHPDFAPGLVTLSNLLWEYGSALSGDNPSDVFRAAIQQQPQHHQLRTAFIDFLLTAREADQALEQIRIARTHSDEPGLVAMQARALDMLGRTEQAGALYTQLHRIWGCGMPAFLNAYTRHLLRAGKWDAAAQIAVEATQADPGNQEAWAYLATAWRLLDDPRETWLCDYDQLIGIVDIEPPNDFMSQSDFLEALKASLDPMHKARREPLQQSLRGGSQTPGRLFGRRDPVLVATAASLLQGVERWLATLPTDDRHPFLMRKTRRVRIGGSWSVKLWSSGRHVNHIHPEGWMSSAFYVSLPPSVRSESATASQAGYIQFGQPPIELDLGLSPRRAIRPQAGMLVLFPSYMWHGTVPFEDAQPRISVAFDMTPREDEP